jgi:hypothetical protein
MHSLGSRRAFTTVELMVVLVVGGMVAAGIATVLRRQQRFFTSAAVLVEQRVSLRDATGILPGELRALSPPSGDVIAFSDSSLDIRATIGTAVVCDTLPNATGVALAPPLDDSGVLISSFTTSPQPGDLALVFDAGVPELSSDDAWLTREISSVAWSTTACATSPLGTRSANTSRMLLRVASGTTFPRTVGPGAFVRVLRRVRYRFYRASTGDWYLGYAEWDGSAFGVVQPVSGPFAGYSRRQGSGLALRYFDESATEIFAASDAARIARVDVEARGLPRRDLAGRIGQLTDSQAVSVRVRNR